MSNNSAIKDYIDAQSDLALAIKNATGFVNNDYADLNEVVRVVKEAFQPRNFVINHVQFATEQGDFLKTVFEHSSGKTWETSVRLLYNPNDMQSLGSPIKVARRYGLSQLGGVISGNKDDDGEQALNPVAREVKRYESITPKKGITLAQQNLLERAVKTENWLIDGATPENFEEGFNRGTVLVKQLNEFSKRIGDAVAEAFSNHKLAKREQENATN